MVNLLVFWGIGILHIGNTLVRLTWSTHPSQGRKRQTIEMVVAGWLLEWVLVDIKVWRLEPGVASTLLHSPWNLSCFPPT